MRREVRRVTADWQHPTDARGHYIPLFDEAYEDAARRWMDKALAWENGNWENGTAEDIQHKLEYPFYWDWNGMPPDSKSYRPKWTSEPTHFQMYENVSEGTPISDICDSPETLAQWLVDNQVDVLGSCPTYEQWLRVARGGYAPSMIIKDGKLSSGVEGLTDESH